MIYEHGNDVININLVRSFYVNKDHLTIKVFFTENHFLTLEFETLPKLQYCITTLKNRMSK